MLRIFFAFLLFILAAGQPVFACDEETGMSSIEMAQSGSAGGTYELEGYLENISTCPPCPPDAVCQPCLMPGSIVVSDEKKPFDGYDKLSYIYDIIIFTKNMDVSKLEIGKKYKFTVKKTDGTVLKQNANYELISVNTGGGK